MTRLILKELPPTCGALLLQDLQQLTPKHHLRYTVYYPLHSSS